MDTATTLSERNTRRIRFAEVMKRHAPTMPYFSALLLSTNIRTVEQAKHAGQCWMDQRGRCKFLALHFEEPQTIDSERPLVPYYSTRHMHLVCRIVAQAQGTMAEPLFLLLCERVTDAYNRSLVGPADPNVQDPSRPDGRSRTAVPGYGNGTDARSVLASSRPVRGGLG